MVVAYEILDNIGPEIATFRSYRDVDDLITDVPSCLSHSVVADTTMTDMFIPEFEVTDITQKYAHRCWSIFSDETEGFEEVSYLILHDYNYDELKRMDRDPDRMREWSIYQMNRSRNGELSFIFLA